MMYDMRELHAMIADAVKEGILAACREMNMGGATSTKKESEESNDSYENAKAYCTRLKAWFNKNSRVYSSDFRNLVREMKKVLTADECRYVVTHIHEVAGSDFSAHADEFIEAYTTL